MPKRPLHSAAISTAGGEESDFTRLHITPLDPDLLHIVIPATLQSSARNVSYHTIETFPEKRYGFVELPVADAEKLKKKLHGSMLKGIKLRVENARPEKLREAAREESDMPKVKKTKTKDGEPESQKRKRDPEVLEGVTLHGRKVKRGWTEPAEHKKRKSKKDKEEKGRDKKKRTRSKHIEGEECLLKTRVPPNAMSNIPKADAPRKRKKRGQAREVIVHEFEKTTKFPSFLKDSTEAANGKPDIEFVEGKGWIDEDGNVVEPLKKKSKPTPEPKKPAPPKPVVADDDDDSTSSSGTSTSGSSSDSDSDAEEERDGQASKDSADDVLDMKQHDAGDLDSKLDSSRPMSSSSARSLTIKIPPPPATPSAGKVHPLEALYKRRKPDANALETPAKSAEPFSFFGTEEGEEDESTQTSMTMSMPMTPFTRQDFEWRTVRSAAPTPDTAHPSRVQNFWASQGEDEPMGDATDPDVLGDVDEEEEEEEEAPQESQGQEGSSDFQSWFWANRGDLNRSWMRRRKAAAKEKRHHENKARASKAV